MNVKKDKYKILVADDEASIRRIVDVRLSFLGYNVCTASDGEEALDIFQNQAPNMIILDVMMPKLDGYQVCKVMRKQSDVPIIMLTALSDVKNKITGLELGADDYIIKPFSLKELEARIHCILRRSAQVKSLAKMDTGVHQVGLLRLDTNKKQIYKANQKVKVTELEFKLLELLVQRPGKPVSRNEMLDRLWGFVPERLDDRRVIDVHISRLRQKLNEVSGQKELISPVRGVGYKLQVCK